MNPFRTMQEKLLRYPPRRLTTGWCYRELRNCHCAMGAIASVDGIEVSTLHSLVAIDEFVTAELDAWAAKEDLGYEDANMVQGINDGYLSMCDEAERYSRMVSILGFLGDLDAGGLTIVREKFRTKALFTWLKANGQ